MQPGSVPGQQQDFAYGSPQAGQWQSQMAAMKTSPQNMQEYAQRGMSLQPPDQGQQQSFAMGDPRIAQMQAQMAAKGMAGAPMPGGQGGMAGAPMGQPMGQPGMGQPMNPQLTQRQMRAQPSPYDSNTLSTLMQQYMQRR